MSTLTKNERDGLDEVFRSIRTSSTTYEKIKYFISLWIDIHWNKTTTKEPQNASTGKFRDKLTKNSNFFTKVKKNLSK